jgi:hypothetical protein
MPPPLLPELLAEFAGVLVVVVLLLPVEEPVVLELPELVPDDVSVLPEVLELSVLPPELEPELSVDELP